MEFELEHIDTRVDDIGSWGKILQIPPTGSADVRVRIKGVDVDEIRCAQLVRYDKKNSTNDIIKIILDSIAVPGEIKGWMNISRMNNRGLYYLKACDMQGACEEEMGSAHCAAWDASEKVEVIDFQ